MTALPTQMPDAEILREFLVNEARALLEAPKINLRAFVRNVFDAMAIEGQGFESIGDAERFITTLIVEARQPLTPYEQNQLGMAVITTFRTRKALDRITLKCACCGRDWRDRLDERRYYVIYDGAHTHTCRECTGDTRGIIAQSVREQLREEGVGVEDLR